MLTWFRCAPGPVWSEAIILVLAVVGIVASFSRRTIAGIDSALVRFLAVYTLLLTAAYSIIPYKTPWCLLSFLHGMILLAGAGAAVLLGMSRRVWVKRIVLVLLAGGGVHLYRQMTVTNFRYYADPRNPYVYAHTSTDFLKLVDRVEDIAAVHPRGKRMLVAVVTSPHDMWPLPWYLRAYGRVGYWTGVEDLPESLRPAMWIASPEIGDRLRARMGDDYQPEFYGLRPEVLLAVYIERTHWERFLETRK
jgi:predicted membrane-bound mannosyltransferase